MVESHYRGWTIYYNKRKKLWLYADDDTPVEGNDRPCPRCWRMPTSDGHDACLGIIPDVISACCGHGMTKPFQMKGVCLVSRRFNVP